MPTKRELKLAGHWAVGLRLINFNSKSWKKRDRQRAFGLLAWFMLIEFMTCHVDLTQRLCL